MKWQTKTAPIALAILAPVLIWWLYPRGSEPTYHGRTLSNWVISEWVSDNGSSQAEEKQEAISHIGTNALPFLVKWIAYQEPRIHLKMFESFIALPTREMKTQLAQGSVTAFYILGPRAAPAIPDLVRLLKGTNEMVALRALTCIDAMGMEGVPALLDFVTNYHAYGSSPALRPTDVMCNLETNGLLVAPVLSQCLKSTDAQVARTTARLLVNVGEHVGVEAQTNMIVPALVEATVSTDYYVRVCAVRGLGRLGSSAQQAVPALERALADPTFAVRIVATNSLRKIAPPISDEKE